MVIIKQGIRGFFQKHKQYEVKHHNPVTRFEVKRQSLFAEVLKATITTLEKQ